MKITMKQKEVIKAIQAYLLDQRGMGPSDGDAFEFFIDAADNNRLLVEIDVEI